MIAAVFAEEDETSHSVDFVMGTVRSLDGKYRVVTIANNTFALDSANEYPVYQEPEP